MPPLRFRGRVASGFGCPETQTCYPTILTESISSNSHFSLLMLYNPSPFFFGLTMFRGGGLTVNFCR